MRTHFYSNSEANAIPSIPHRIVRCLATAMVARLPSSAIGQEPPANEFLSLSLDELAALTVHAQKREEPLSQVPVSASVITTDQIQRHLLQD